MKTSRTITRQEGNAAILALVSLTLLAGLSMAQFSFTRKNVQQSDYFLSRAALRRSAESGMATGFHHLTYDLDGGSIGTVGWDPSIDDLGEDGIGTTGDHGEGDGIPTPGEPNVAPVAVGSDVAGANLIVHVSDTGIPGVKRIVATCFIPGRDGESVTLEKQVQSNAITIPRPGSVYIEPGVVLDLQGNNFLIDGHDTNPDGTPGPGPDQYGISTAEGGTPGDNSAALVAQVGNNQDDNILGVGADPSIGEVAGGIDVDALYSQFVASPNQTIPAGTYDGVAWGDWASSDMVTTYVPGNLRLSGTASGAGVLIVDGDLTVIGEFEFAGIIIVTGDARFTGGGSGTHLWGTLMTKGSTQVDVGGSAELIYSSVVLDTLETSVTASSGYNTVYYGERN